MKKATVNTVNYNKHGQRVQSYAVDYQASMIKMLGFIDVAIWLIAFYQLTKLFS